MSARAAVWLLIPVYLTTMFALLAVIGRVYGTGWEIGLLPVEIIGGAALGALAVHAGRLS